MKPKKRSKRENEILEIARELPGGEDEPQIDDDAKISEGDDNGAYVQAWIWVDFAGTVLDKEVKS